mgnify:CR=1 FL=1
MAEASEVFISDGAKCDIARIHPAVGTDADDAATARERNLQIGGHKA